MKQDQTPPWGLGVKTADQNLRYPCPPRGEPTHIIVLKFKISSYILNSKSTMKQDQTPPWGLGVKTADQNLPYP
jgi:hypothetical protein